MVSFESIHDQIRNGYILSAIQDAIILTDSKDDLLFSLFARTSTLETDRNLMKVSNDSYRNEKVGIIETLITRMRIYENVKPKVVNMITFNIQNQVNNGGIVNMGETIALGDTFLALASKKSGISYDEADSNLLKAVGAILEKDDERSIIEKAVNDINSESTAPTKAIAKNKVSTFLLTYGVPTLKVLGKAALSIILVKYGIKLADLGLEA